MLIISQSFRVLLLLPLVGTSLVLGAQTLPSIWMDEAGEMNYYRFRAELQLLDAAKSFIIEEWVSVWRQMFRFDLIKSTGDARITFLANKLTNEKYRYKPFSCSLMTDDLTQDSGAWMSEDSAGTLHLTEDLGAWISDDLSGLFPSDSSNTLLPVGIGSLWLHALKLKSTFTPASDEELRIKTSAQVLKGYDKYTVPASETNPHGITFYFHQETSSSSGGGGEGHTLKSLAMVEVQDGSKRVLMRIKILEAEENWNNNMQDNNDYLDLFDLPTGYGCQRAAQFDHPFSMESQSGIESYSLLMNMVSIQPKDLDHDLAQWKSHSMSARLLTGHIESNDGDKQLKNKYLIMETQDYAPDEISPKMYGSAMRQATVRRLKRVWDLGPTTGDHEVHEFEQNQIRYFELDLLTNQCLKHNDLNSNTFVYLTRNPITARRDLPAPLNELTFNTKLLQQFLFDLTGFHLLKDVEKAHQRELVYERRFELLEMRNEMGELIWEGPVSVVRYYRKRPFKHDFEITAVVYFLTDNRDKLVGKFRVEAQPKRPISVAHLHQSLNVASCFSALLNKPVNGETSGQQMRRKQSDNDGIKFALTFSIEPQEIVEQATDSEEFEVSIYEHFLRALLYISNEQLDLLQLVDVNIDYDVSQAVAKVAARLVEKPSLFNYLEEVNLGFASPSPPGATLLIELKADEEGCAESCQHYGCPMFVYCKMTNMCNLLMADYKRQEDSQSPLLETNTGCSLFKARSGRDEPTRRVNLAHLLHQIQRTILISSEERQQQQEERPVNELELDIHFIDSQDSDAVVRLIPIKLESGALQLDDPDQFYAMQTTIGDQLDVAAGFDEERKPRAEYVLTYKNRKYKRPFEADTNLFPVQEALHMSYEQCEALCEQSDCRSFSHCQLEQICQVSQLHETSSIEKYIEQEELCFLMTRDYLSKFELIFQVPKPHQNSLIKPDKVATSRDCAVRCMEEQNFRCLSFLYCSLSGAPVGQVDSFDGFDCYLRRSHAPTSQGDPSPKKAAIVANQSDEIYLKPMCDLYTRSFLAEFDKYYGKALPESQEVGQQLDRLVLEGFGSEFCALKCIEFADGSCGAFQACYQMDSDAPSCTLLTVSGPKNDLLVNRLIDDKKCTTFILSQESELNNHQSDANVVQLPETSETHTKQQQPSSADSGHWLTITILLLIGLAVGYGIAMKFAPRYS